MKSSLRGGANRKPALKRSPCPIAGTLDIMGDKWTLLVVRDLFMGKSTYGHFQKSPEGIPTNILADRLKRLEQAGIIDKARYQERPVRYSYRLTPKGRGLKGVLMAMVDWGNKYLDGTVTTKEIKSMLAKAGR